MLSASASIPATSEETFAPGLAHYRQESGRRYEVGFVERRRHGSRSMGNLHLRDALS